MTRNVVVAIVTIIVVGLGIVFQVTTATTHDEKSPDTGTPTRLNPGSQSTKAS